MGSFFSDLKAFIDEPIAGSVSLGTLTLLVGLVLVLVGLWTRVLLHIEHAVEEI